MRAKKSLGQNFLRDGEVIRRIAASLNLSSTDNVVEIGPGRGALTTELLTTGASVVAVEIDRGLIPLLGERFRRDERFRLVEADILQTDMKGLIAGLDGETKVVGNLPYYISTSILQKLAAERHLFSFCVLMLQREVVDRITALPGSSERGYLTVLTEAAFDVERLFDVSPTSFAPQPKVWSSVVRLTPKPLEAGYDDRLAKLASVAFAQKRKTILNNLRSHIQDAAVLLETAGIDPRRRAETLSLVEWRRLEDTFNKEAGTE